MIGRRNQDFFFGKNEACYISRGNWQIFSDIYLSISPIQTFAYVVDSTPTIERPLLQVCFVVADSIAPTRQCFSITVIGRWTTQKQPILERNGWVRDKLSPAQSN
jgi:hypothetical protein